MSFAAFWRSSLHLRAGFCDNFSGANFCFCFLFWVLMFLIGICLWFSVFFSQLRPGSVFFYSLLVRSCFFVSFSLCLKVWVDDVVCVVSLSSLFLSRQSSGLAGHHTPPCACCCRFFLSPPLCLVRLFWPCVLFVLGFLRGAILGPARFLDSLRTLLRPFSWTLGGKGVCSFFWCVVFPVLRLHTFLVGLAPVHRKAGPRVVSPAPLTRVRVRG